MQQTGGDDKGNLQKIGEGLGGLMGQAADTAMGMFGTMMSNMGGWWEQSAAQQQGQQGGFSASFSTERDQECQRHFSAQAQGGGVRSYDQARPLYQLGHMAGQNPDYQGRTFDQVEMDLQRNWGGDQQKRYGAWPDVRGYVQFGYQGARPGSASGAGFQATGGSGGGGGGGFQASGSTGSGAGFEASVKSDESGTEGRLDASGGSSGGGSTQGGTSGGFRASGGFETDR